MSEIPTSSCRNCQRLLTLDVHAGQWQDQLGSYICPKDRFQGHLPLIPVEGIDYE